ncbi:MAG: hypothetical protein JW751_06925 [Polyangiaceae bacterium]|nr:hypothetical protein [Polyangiaceae bacterium]
MPTLVFAGLTQAAAATALGTGLAAKQQWYVRNNPVALRVDPVVVGRREERPGTYGLSVSGVF